LIDFLLTWLTATFDIIRESSVFLLAGFVIAGLAHIFIPFEWIRDQLGKQGLGSILKSSLFGLPLPLCSCSVIPVAVSLRKAGASRGATASFLVSTPEIGVDSFAISSALLGLPFTIIRTFTAFLAAILSGVLVEQVKFEPYETELARSCCGHKKENKKGLVEAFRFAFWELPADLSRLLLLGFLAAGLASCMIPDQIPGLDRLSEIQSMLIMLVASIPVYVCATAMTPLAAVLVSKGLGAGAALVLLLAGPATNLATILAAREMFGNRGLIAYLLAISGTAIVAGLIVNNIPVDLTSINFDSSKHSHKAPLVAPILLTFILVRPIATSLFWRLRGN